MLDLTLSRDYTIDSLFQQVSLNHTQAHNFAKVAWDAGVRHIRIRNTVNFTQHDLDLLLTIALLRDCSALGLPIEYDALFDDSVSVAPLRHLEPPSYCSGADETELNEWRERHHYMMLVYRRGGTFWQVDDRRYGASKFVINEKLYLADAESLIRSSSSEALNQEVLDAFLAAGLVIRVGEHALWLPARSRRLPIPAFAI